MPRPTATTPEQKSPVLQAETPGRVSRMHATAILLPMTGTRAPARFAAVLRQPMALGLSLLLSGAFGCFSASPTFAATNLLTNPGAETGDFTGWTVIDNGGDRWSETFDGVAHSGDHSFATSYGWDSRYQKVNLLTAYTAEQLDSGQYSITFSEWVASRPDKSAQYYVTFKLLGADGDPAHPIATFSSGSESSPNVLAANVTWFQVAHTFSGFGTGVRYAYVEDGGRDSQDPGWAGDYGAHFDDASLSVDSTDSSSSSSASAQHVGGHHGSTGDSRIREALQRRAAEAAGSALSSSAPAPTPAEPPQDPFRERICQRVLRASAGNDRMLRRIDQRLARRFGFTCQP